MAGYVFAIRNKQWNALRLIKYSYEDGSIHYVNVTPQIDGVDQ